MKKKIFTLLLISLFGVLIFACSKSHVNSDLTNVFSNGSDERNLIVIISDQHLGADLRYAEMNVNIDPFKKFLKEIRQSKNVKELIIAGDLIDEWFVPATVDTYKGLDQADFVKRVASTNKVIFDQLNKIIQEGIISVTYVPGNHDLTVTAENISKILPGISQARDVLGLGVYSPDSLSEIAIEHGHRYNFFCAPDPLSNQDIAPGTILPPGYFFTRIAALHVDQKCKKSDNIIPGVTPNISGDESQAFLYEYWKLWAWTLDIFPVKNTFKDSMIITNVNGFVDSCSINDVLPYQDVKDGPIAVKLFNGCQNSWAERCVLNHVPIDISTEFAIKNSAKAVGTDTMAVTQYFMNPASNKRIVVFGHTHVAKMKSYNNYKGEKCIYANSGTWIDHNPLATTMNFVVITPQSEDSISQTNVVLYNFEKQVLTEMARDSIRL